MHLYRLGNFTVELRYNNGMCSSWLLSSDGYSFLLWNMNQWWYPLMDSYLLKTQTF